MVKAFNSDFVDIHAKSNIRLLYFLLESVQEAAMTFEIPCGIVKNFGEVRSSLFRDCTQLQVPYLSDC